MVADGVRNTISFGPALLVNGHIPSSIETFQVDTNLGAARTPRRHRVARARGARCAGNQLFSELRDQPQSRVL